MVLCLTDQLYIIFRRQHHMTQKSQHQEYNWSSLDTPVRLPVPMGQTCSFHTMDRDRELRPGCGLRCYKIS